MSASAASRVSNLPDFPAREARDASPTRTDACRHISARHCRTARRAVRSTRRAIYA
ncbi:hypothetical protein [Candidatus Methanocrinis natronophilus]|uniref:Uncharacterized protein n=1 Tax=Candidatus Methanocrinis natronophilus TaxID=3033396 RepID=A0ABT5X7I7_9EURY|nr:hypothetical protein [Candidatus Methanocrinis natronophilus]MDF0590636.1 hypothetical protein [Candidatus Methanocrinis natronophilus]